jgi:hypothetical protein
MSISEHGKSKERFKAALEKKKNSAAKSNAVRQSDTGARLQPSAGKKSKIFRRKSG